MFTIVIPLAHPATFAALHVVLLALAAAQFRRERRIYRQAMAAYAAKVLARRFVDPLDRELSRPRPGYIWWIYLLPLAATYALLLWGGVHR